MRNDSSVSPSISAHGRFVTFSSIATNLVSGDPNGGELGRLRCNSQTDTTWRVSLGSGGAQGNGSSGGSTISANGRFVAFSWVATNLVPDDTNGKSDIFVRDRKTSTTIRVNFGPGGVQGNGGSGIATISADGRFVAFKSGASNLVPGDTNETQQDIFVRQTGTTERVSLGQVAYRAMMGV